jgi:hypothetical protein
MWQVVTVSKKSTTSIHGVVYFIHFKEKSCSFEEFDTEECVMDAENEKRI